MYKSKSFFLLLLTIFLSATHSQAGTDFQAIKDFHRLVKEHRHTYTEANEGTLKEASMNVRTALMNIMRSADAPPAEKEEAKALFDQASYDIIVIRQHKEYSQAKANLEETQDVISRIR